jgi:hypothetical protein
MEFGGPVWHASGRRFDHDLRFAEVMARNALSGVGDAGLGEWAETGTEGSGVFHVRRRLTPWEQRIYGIPVVRDIRGSPEEKERFGRLATEAPHLKTYLQQRGLI